MAGPKLTSLTIVFLLTTSALNWASPPSCTDDCAPFIPGAVAYWPMTSETKGSDLSGNENHAKFVGLTYTDGPTGEENGAVHFNGSSNSFASVTNFPSMHVGKYPGFSFSGFVRFGIHYKSASLIDWSGDDGNGVYIMATSEQKILVKLHPIHDTDFNHIAEFPNLKFNKSSWHFIGVSYDKATGRITVFKDGKHELKQLDKNIVAGTDKTKQVGLGIDLSKQSEFSYNGDMGCMMLFKFALTSYDFERVLDFCRKPQSTQTELPSITVSDVAATRATASWSVSPGIFSGYKITIERRRSELDQELAHPPFIPASVTFPKSVILTHLVPGATYRVRVRHMQGDILGRERSSAWFATKPSLVVESDSIIFSDITANYANVSWKDVTGNYDAYSVDISPATGGAKADPSSVPRGTTTTSLKNLSPRTYYTIRIITKIGLHTAYPSTRSFYTPEQSLAVEFDSIIFSELTATSGNVSWKDVTGNYDGYSVDISPTTGGAKADPSAVGRGTTSTSLKNLLPGNYYIITIRTMISSRTSSPTYKIIVFQTMREAMGRSMHGLPIAIEYSVFLRKRARA